MNAQEYAEATARIAAQQFRKVLLAERKAEREEAHLEVSFARVPDSGIATYMELTEGIRKDFEQ